MSRIWFLGNLPIRSLAIPVAADKTFKHLMIKEAWMKEDKDAKLLDRNGGSDLADSLRLLP